MNNINDVSLPYLEMGSGFLLGLAMGYALKKSFKLLLIISGLGIMFVFLLESQNVVSMNDQQLQNTVDIAVNGIQIIFDYLKTRLERYSLASSGVALVGFMTGIKIA